MSIYAFFFMTLRRGRDRMLVGFITIYAISCEFEPRSGKVCSIQHYVILICINFDLHIYNYVLAMCQKNIFFKRFTKFVILCLLMTTSEKAI